MSKVVKEVEEEHKQTQIGEPTKSRVNSPDV